MQQTVPAGNLLVVEFRRGAGSATDRRYVMPRSDLQFQKALHLLDRGDLARGEAILRETLAAAVYFTCGGASRVRHRGRSTALRQATLHANK